MVDELTKRQFIETCRFGEDKMVSMILVTTGTRLSSNTKDEILVVARRVNEEVEGGVVEVLKGIEPERLAIQNREKRGLPGGYTGGLIRHDPDRSVFSADRPVLGREEYASAVATALSSHLPIELVTDILSLVDNDSPQRIPAWESPENEQRLVIFLLCHTTTTEYNQTRESLENGMRKHVRIENDQKVEIELIPWEHHGIASRRELITFWYRYRLHEHPSVTGLNFLLGPIHDVDSAQFGIVNSCHGDDIPALSTRTTLAGMIQGMREECSKIRYLDPDDVQAEGMYVPDQPFYPNPPPWLPVGEGDESYEFIGIFYLTNQLTNEQDWAIREFIKSQCEGEEETLYSKECCYIPWKSGSGSVDATMEDVWEIVWNAYTYAAERGRDWHCLFFIDRQSAFDCSLLMAVQDWYRGGDSAVKGFLRGITCPRLRGFYYTRVDGNEAHVIHFNIDKPLRGIETFDDVTRFRRPDWPGPGVMPGDDGSIPDASGPFNGISP